MPGTTDRLDAFPGALRRWRTARRLSQLELALRAGTTQRHLSFIEQGRSRPPFARSVGTLRRIAVGSRAQLTALARAIAVGRLRPVIDRAFPFDEAPEAFAHYAAGGAIGKTVIAVP